MKIVLTGGGSGGHFYPLVAVAEALETIAVEKKLLEPKWTYIGPEPFDRSALSEHDIEYVPSPAGKMRRYASMFNVIDLFKTAIGVLRSITLLFRIFPDVVFSTGGFAAFPTLFAAKTLGIPVVMYDADAKPGRVSLWASGFARWIALSHAEAAAAFPTRDQKKIACVGHPIRKEIETPAKEGGHEFLKLSADVPTIFIIGGSQGASAINDAVIDALPTLVERYNVVHQVGRDNFKEVSGIAAVVLKGLRYEDRYRCYGLLNVLAMRMITGISSLIVSRAGSGSIFEIATWRIPAILVPIPLDVSHDQTENAFSYARIGGCTVIEQANLKPHVLIAEIDRIMQDPALQENMRAAGRSYSHPDAAKKIAQIIIETALEHTN